MSLPIKLNERERLLVEAVLAHDPGPNPRRHRANGTAILRHAMTAAGIWNQDRYGSLACMDDCAEPEEWFAALIALARRPEGERLVDGFGYFGTEDLPPSCPAYVGFEPTAWAREAMS